MLFSNLMSVGRNKIEGVQRILLMNSKGEGIQTLLTTQEGTDFRNKLVESPNTLSTFLPGQRDPTSVVGSTKTWDHQIDFVHQILHIAADVPSVKPVGGGVRQGGAISEGLERLSECDKHPSICL